MQLLYTDKARQQAHPRGLQVGARSVAVFAPGNESGCLLTGLPTWDTRRVLDAANATAAAAAGERNSSSKHVLGQLVEVACQETGCNSNIILVKCCSIKGALM
jgi:hypothetical protein